jgi:hypothetical protein
MKLLNKELNWIELCSVYTDNSSLASCYYLSKLHSEFGTEISEQNFHVVSMKLNIRYILKHKNKQEFVIPVPMCIYLYKI